MPELIRDVNGVNFGNKADDTPLRDVQLPPWAEDSPERFIALHREALGTQPTPSPRALLSVKPCSCARAQRVTTFRSTCTNG